MTGMLSHKTLRRNVMLAACAVVGFVAPAAASESRSQDLQTEIANLSDDANNSDNAARNAENAGDMAEACRLFRRAGDKWREAANAGTSLIVETMNDGNLDPDAVNENVHIMANNAQVDDDRAEAVCK